MSLYSYLDFVLNETTLSFDYTATSLTCFHCGSYVKDFDTDLYLFSYTKILLKKKQNKTKKL